MLWRPWILKVKFWKCCISGMGGPIDLEQRGCELIGCYTHFVTFNFVLNHDLDLGFSRSNFEKIIYQEWDGWLTWDERDVNQENVGPLLWLSTFPTPMTLTLDFQGQILKKSYLRNGMADWHGTKGMWVNRMLDSRCDFKLWPHPWPWPWIFKVKYLNCLTQEWEAWFSLNERDVSWIWCWMHNRIDLGSRCMANRSVKWWVNVKLLKFPTSWPMNGLFIHWYRGWGVLSFSEGLVPFKKKQCQRFWNQIKEFRKWECLVYMVKESPSWR